MIGRYLIVGCVGAGGMGVVYSAYDPELADAITKPQREAAAAWLRAHAE